MSSLRDLSKFLFMSMTGVTVDCIALNY